MTKSGWLLIPVGGIPDELDTNDFDALDAFARSGAFDFENGDTYSNVSEHGQFAFIDSDDAPTFDDAIEKKVGGLHRC